jgi:hypothetical protein
MVDLFYFFLQCTFRSLGIELFEIRGMNVTWPQPPSPQHFDTSMRAFSVK